MPWLTGQKRFVSLSLKKKHEEGLMAPTDQPRYFCFDYDPATDILTYQGSTCTMDEPLVYSCAIIYDLLLNDCIKSIYGNRELFSCRIETEYKAWQEKVAKDPSSVIPKFMKPIKGN